jgi:hypothetical protein
MIDFVMKAWPVVKASWIYVAFAVVTDILMNTFMQVISLGSEGWEHTNLWWGAFPAAAIARSDSDTPVDIAVHWTRDGLVPEGAIARLSAGRAELVAQDGTDLRDWSVVAFLPAGEAPPQSRARRGRTWVELSQGGQTRFLRADNRVLPLIGRCAGWADPRVTKI